MGMIVLRPLDVALLVAAGLSALVVPWLAAPRRGEGEHPGLHWGPALGLFLGYAAFQYATAHPAFPPSDVTDRVPWLALAALVLGLFESARPGPAWTRWENRLLLTGLTLGVVLGPTLASSEGHLADAKRLSVMGLGLLGCWANVEGLARRSTARTLGPVVLAVGGGATVVLLVTGSVVYGQLAGGLSALLGLVWVASWSAPELSLSRGTVPVAVTILGSLLLCGATYSSTPGWSVVLLAAAPVAAWPAYVGPGRRLASWQATLLGLVNVLVPVGLAVWLAVAASPTAEGY